MRVTGVDEDVQRRDAEALANPFAHALDVRTLDEQDVTGDQDDFQLAIEKDQGRGGQRAFDRRRAAFLHGVAAHTDADRRRDVDARDTGEQEPAYWGWIGHRRLPRGSTNRG